MEHQIQARGSDPRFPVYERYATLRIGKDPFVDSAIEPQDELREREAHERHRPHAYDWLWRPWYAKLWWVAIAIYWAGKLGSLYLSILDQFYTGVLAGFLNIAFFPPLALMVLGMGYARAWFAWSDWEFVEPTHEQMFPKRSVGGLRDPHSDPLDPRSGMLHWRHFHPDR